jgi:hypothetical protein
MATKEPSGELDEIEKKMAPRDRAGIGPYL